MLGKSIREVPTGLGTTLGLLSKLPENKDYVNNVIIDLSFPNLKSLLPGQGEFEFRIPRVQNSHQLMKFHKDGGMREAP